MLNTTQLNHLVSLAKWLSVRLRTKWLWVRVPLQSLKRGNVVPIFKKGDKQIYKNYQPISLSPIFRKILERLIFEEMFPFFLENKSIAANQSGFKSGDSS